MTLFRVSLSVESSDLAVAAGGFWVAVTAIMLAVLAGSSLRVVPEHERLVVSRLGRISRLAGPGLVFRVPGLERGDSVSLLPVHVPLTTTALTRDGVRVRLDVRMRYRVTDPALATAAVPDVQAATELAVEAVLQREVAHVELDQLLQLRYGLERRLPREVTAQTLEWGVELAAVEITDIETRLTPDLLRRAR